MINKKKIVNQLLVITILSEFLRFYKQKIKLVLKINNLLFKETLTIFHDTKKLKNTNNGKEYKYWK